MSDAGAGGIPEHLRNRCGSCARFVRVIEVAARDGGMRKAGECLLAIWPAPLYENNTCAKYVQRGMFASTLARTPRSKGGSERVGARGPRAQGANDDRTEPARAWPPANFPKDLLAMDADEFRSILQSVIREELGTAEVEMAGKWQGGEIVLVPGKPGLQERRIGIESLFRKVVSIRDKLRVLEQKINGHDKLGDDDKVQFQQYITGAYGSLTTFNVLFADKEDGFAGNKSDDA